MKPNRDLSSYSLLIVVDFKQTGMGGRDGLTSLRFNRNAYLGRRVCLECAGHKLGAEQKATEERLELR